MSNVKKIIITILVLFLVGGAIFIQNKISENNKLVQNKSQDKQLQKSPSNPTIAIDNQIFNLLVATTLPEQELGLSKRQSMPSNVGMLFIFDKPDYYGFWMKDMLFPLDIIFIKNDKIVTIVNDLQYPKNNTSKLQIFKPAQPADKVLEINAGLTRKYNFKLGDTVKISL